MPKRGQNDNKDHSSGRKRQKNSMSGWWGAPKATCIMSRENTRSRDGFSRGLSEISLDNLRPTLTKMEMEAAMRDSTFGNTYQMFTKKHFEYFTSQKFRRLLVNADGKWFKTCGKCGGFSHSAKQCECGTDSGGNDATLPPPHKLSKPQSTYLDVYAPWVMGPLLDINRH